ncbi:MAG: hypothetical protein BZ136_07465 [Methanosphaera sp. rholeuAM74]|nr:MAG: hypothetical protein BZ136_07465 [Methanosphaera sp. rholeuAM74]
MNQVRALAYLLKKLTFEAGLGINNLTTQLETFKANLNTIARDVLKEVEIITEITFDDKIIVHSHDHIELSLNVEVGGVVTRIDIGVNMTLQNPTNVVTSAEE